MLAIAGGPRVFHPFASANIRVNLQVTKHSEVILKGGVWGKKIKIKYYHWPSTR